MSNTNPQVQSWLICDNVHIDQSTGKYYLLGVFSHLRSRSFPFQHPRMFFFLTLANLVEGKHTLKISVSLPPEEPQKLIEREFEAEGPQQRISLISDIQKLGFGQPGAYAITIEVDGEVLLTPTLPVVGPNGETTAPAAPAAPAKA